MRKDYGQPAFF